LFGDAQIRGDVVTYCLPDAGSGASAFGGWLHRFPSSIEIRPLRLPGREDRVGEPVRLSPVELADSIARRTGRRPFALYGHSMGARLAFEVVRELLRRPGVTPPVALYVGAALPPDVRPSLADAVDLPDDQLVAALMTRAGAGPALRDEPELRELILPVVRADLDWVASYRYEPEPGLPMPVIGIAGAADRDDGALPMLGWSRHAAGDFRLYTVPGGHAFHRSTPPELVPLLAADLLACVRGAPPPLNPPGPDEVHVFAGRVDDLQPAEAADALPADDARAAAGIRDDVERRGFVARRVVLRRLMRRYGIDPDDRGPSRPDNPWFGAGHAGGRVVVAVTGGHDIDVERAVETGAVAAVAAVAVARDGWRLRFERLGVDGPT
jgi:surfactin synthase thioesterase subunit